MRAAVQGQLAPLAEAFLAAADPAHEGLLISVSVLVLSQVLRQSEHLRAEFTLECFLVAMDVVVSLEGKLGCEAFATALKLAFVL